MRRKLFARVRHSVCSKLFLAKPTFCQHLVEINQFVSDISQVKMSYCNSNHLYQLEEYSDLQVVTREQKAKPALESTSEKVQQVSHTLQLSCCTCTENRACAVEQVCHNTSDHTCPVPEAISSARLR